MTLARSGWAEEVDHLVTVDKIELGKGENAIAVVLEVISSSLLARQAQKLSAAGMPRMRSPFRV
jgi:hypothetical protein